VKAADRLAEHINSMGVSDVNRYLSDLNSANGEFQRRNSAPAHVTACGYNPWHKQSLENVWDEMQSVLPRAVRKRGLDDFINKSPVEGSSFSVTIGEDIQNIWDTLDEEGLVIPKNERPALEEVDHDVAYM